MAVSPSGTTPAEHEPLAQLDDAGDVSFAELVEASIGFAAAQGGDRQAVAGVQPKVSAGTISLPVRAARARAAPGSFILKLEPDDPPRLVANERFFMTLAREVGLEVAVVRPIEDRDGRPGLLVARFDRGRTRDGRRKKFAQEDACQLLDRYPADKYRIALRDFASALDVCTAPTPERLRLMQLVAFSCLIANGDLHAKNLSVRTAEGHDASGAGLRPADGAAVRRRRDGAAVGGAGQAAAARRLRSLRRAERGAPCGHRAHADDARRAATSAAR